MVEIFHKHSPFFTFPEYKQRFPTVNSPLLERIRKRRAFADPELNLVNMDATTLLTTTTPLTQFHTLDMSHAAIAMPTILPHEHGSDYMASPALPPYFITPTMVSAAAPDTYAVCSGFETYPAAAAQCADAHFTPLPLWHVSPLSMASAPTSTKVSPATSPNSTQAQSMELITPVKKPKLNFSIESIIGVSL